MKWVKKFVGIAMLAALLALLAYLMTHPRFLSDWIVLRGYTPTERIARIVDETSMTDEARKVFYVATPEIEPASTFNKHCTIREVSIVLGCYDGKDIYVFDVQDERLVGVHEVTAVHEMLHAAYDRLSESERERVDRLTEKTYIRLTNSRIKATVESYRARDASVVPNELHSILATEVRDIDPELEAYYQRYFVDRSKVVALSEGYEQIFTDIKAIVDRLDADLTLLKAQINALEADLSTRSSSITNTRDQLNTYLATNQVTRYNNAVPGYNASVNAYNNDLNTYRSLINTYNEKVRERNAQTVVQNDLVDSLDSRAKEL